MSRKSVHSYNSRHDDFLAARDELSQVGRVFRMPDRRTDLRELLDGVADLLVEDLSVGDDDDRVEDRRRVLLQTNQLMRQPRNRIRFARTRRMLNQIFLTRTARLCVL